MLQFNDNEDYYFKFIKVEFYSQRVCVRGVSLGR